MDEELIRMLKYLRLGGLLAHWDEYLTLAGRQRFSHVRLGVPAQLIDDWMRAGGLQPGPARTLSPPADEADGKLTVSIWIAEKSAVARSNRAQAPAQRKLERAE